MSETDWTHGIPMERLKSLAAVFRDAHKRHVYGAFGLVKERDIAAALAEDALLVKRENDVPAACAILHRLKNPGRMTDVAAREIAIPPGHVKVTAIAARRTEPAAALLAYLAEKHGPRLWVEAFEEDDVMRAALARVPQLQWVATRIAAGSEVKGMYTTAPVDGLAPLHPAEAASLVVLDDAFITEDDQRVLLGEIDRTAETWAQHYSTYNKRQSWTAIALRGYDAADPTFIIKPAEMAQSWKAEHPERMKARAEWTRAAHAMPCVMAVVERIVCGAGADRIRLMRLAPKGELARHADITDRDAGLADGRLARLHLPLRTSPRVTMRGWDKRGGQVETRFPERALCYLDQRGPHQVVNGDPECQRIHLVVDVESDSRLRGVIADAMQSGHEEQLRAAG